jgi:heterodisulfide reductase subunit B
MQIGFYPGCSLEGSSREYSESVVALAKAFDIELTQIPDWNCCGATAAHNLNKMLSLSLPARIMALAEKAGMKEVVIPCAACYNRLASTQYELHDNPELLKEVCKVMEMEFSATLSLLNPLQFIEKFISPKINEKQKKSFHQKVACYYGCLLVRPNKVLHFDREEDPQVMDTIMKSIGAEAIDWAFKTECCGAGFSVSKTDTVARLSARIVSDALDRGAEAIIVACPMCHSNLDMRRKEIDKVLNHKTKIPVLYITQAIGLAVGIPDKELGISRHFIPVKTKLQEIAKVEINFEQAI